MQISNIEMHRKGARRKINYQCKGEEEQAVLDRTSTTALLGTACKRDREKRACSRIFQCVFWCFD